MTLFVPGAVMKNENFVLLLELTGRQKSKSLQFDFLAQPLYNGEGERQFQNDQPLIEREDVFEDDEIVRNPVPSGYLRYF